MFYVISSIISYVIGSISFAVIITEKRYGKDIRTTGSGNAGATNVLRTWGKKAAALVFFCDFAKGFIAVMIARLLVIFFEAPTECILFAGFFAQVGHCFPVFFRFRGGKGVATSAGAAMGVLPAVSIALIMIFTIIVLISKTASIASCICAAVYPVLTCFATNSDNNIFIFSAACSVLIIIMHRGNIARLLDGEERKISS